MTGLSGGTSRAVVVARVQLMGPGPMSGMNHDAPVARYEATDSERGLQVKVTFEGFVHYNQTN